MNLYLGQKVRTKLENTIADESKTGKGVRQGCEASRIFYSIFTWKKWSNSVLMAREAEIFSEKELTA